MPFSKENRLLLSCITSKLDEQAAHRAVEILAKRLDWNYLLQTAEQSGVAAVFFYNLRQIGAEPVIPQKIWQELTRAYHRVGFKNSIFYAELGGVLRALKEVGVEAILLKGAALAEEVWKNVALREMADIDLLVRKEDLRKADATLSNLGYIHHEEHKDNEWYLENHHHLAPFYKPGVGIYVEIHHSLSFPNRFFRFNTEGVWERAQTIKLGDAQALVLSPEDLISHLCLHLSGFDYFVGKIKNLADICEVIDYCAPRIEWDLILANANKGGYARLIFYPLRFAHDIFGAAVDKQVLDELQDSYQLGFVEDRMLKLVVKSRIISKDVSSSILPDWFPRLLCRQLLLKDDTHNESGSLLETMVWPYTESGSDTFYSSHPRLASLYYPILGILKLIAKISKMTVRTISQKVITTSAR